MQNSKSRCKEIKIIEINCFCVIEKLANRWHTVFEFLGQTFNMYVYVANVCVYVGKCLFFEKCFKKISTRERNY